MTKRLSNENIPEEFLKSMIKCDSDNNGVKPAQVYADMRGKFWDIDDNDLRQAVARLFADHEIYLTHDRKLKRIRG